MWERPIGPNNGKENGKIHDFPYVDEANTVSFCYDDNH